MLLQPVGFICKEPFFFPSDFYLGESGSEDLYLTSTVDVRDIVSSFQDMDISWEVVHHTQVQHILSQLKIFLECVHSL